MKRLSLLYILAVLSMLTCTKKDDDPTILTPENDFIEYDGNLGTIGIAGGSITLNDASSKINGASITIPAGALGENTPISFEHDNQTTFPHNESAIIVKFEPEGLEFKKPVIITIPYKDDLDKPSLFYFQPDSNRLEKIPLKINSLSNKTVTAEILHFSRYFSDEDNGIYTDVELFKKQLIYHLVLITHWI